MFDWLTDIIGKLKAKVSSPLSTADEWVPPQASVSSAEEMCGIDPNIMNEDVIRKKLAELYKRHNHAVSSLNPDLRREGAEMLEAIVVCRERYVD